MRDPTIIADLMRAGVTDPDLLQRVIDLALSADMSADMSADKLGLSADKLGLSTMSADAKLHDRRERDRARKAKERAAAKTSGAISKANDVEILPGLSTPAVQGLSADNSDTTRNLTYLLPLEGLSNKKKESKVVVARARATRLSAAQPISEIDLKFAVANGVAEHAVPSVWVEFVDYWISVPGQRGVKLDWSATWRNWIRRKAEKGQGVSLAARPNGGVRSTEEVHAILRSQGVGGYDGKT